METKLKDKTTIGVSRLTAEKIMALRVHRRDCYEDILERLLEERNGRNKK